MVWMAIRPLSAMNMSRLYHITTKKLADYLDIPAHISLYLSKGVSIETTPSVEPTHSTVHDATAQAKHPQSINDKPSDNAHKKPAAKLSPAPVLSIQFFTEYAGI